MDSKLISTIIEYVIKFGPTVLFILAVLFPTITGLIRGFRKSLVLFIHASVVGILCLTLFMIFSKSTKFDAFLLHFTDLILGGDNALAEKLGLPGPYETMRGLIMDYIPSKMSFAEGLESVLRDNGAYILTLVDMTYRIVFSTFFYIVYLLLLILLYFIYLIFYNTRRYIKKRNNKFQLGEVDTPYRKRKLFGAGIGLFRGLIRGTVILSFLGMLFFVIAGGKGDREVEEMKFDNDTYNIAYTAYKSINQYGTSGIYKVYNEIKDVDGLPYYLYAADLIYQGGLVDENLGIDTNIYLREELSAYVDFSYTILNLLIKYGGEDIEDILNGKSTKDVMTVVLEVFKQPEFREDFNKAINNFDMKTYFINLALSLLSTMPKLFVDTEDASPITDLILICFQKGYISNNIPYERKLKDRGEEVELGYINISYILNKNDIRELLNLMMDVLDLQEEGEELNMESLLKYSKHIINYLSRLSLFKEKNRDKINPVIMRVYALLEANYLLDSEGNGRELDYTDKSYKTIDFMGEITTLISYLSDMVTLYNSAMEEELDFSAENAITSINTLLNKGNNMQILDNIINYIASSRILGEVLESSLIREQIEGVLSNVSEDITIPSNMRYANMYNENGSIESYGELYYLLTAIRRLLEDQKLTDLFDEIKNLNDGEGSSIIDTLNDVAQLLLNGDEGDRVVDYLASSKLLRIVFTGVCERLSTGDLVIYLDESVKEEEIVTKEELVLLFEVIPGVINDLKDFIENSGDYSVSSIIEKLKGEGLKNSLNSKILEGTLAKFAFTYLKDSDVVIIPEGLAYVSNKNEDSEIKKLINIFTSDIIKPELLEGESIGIDSFRNITDENLDTLLSSVIIQYTLSDILINKSSDVMESLKIIVPTSVREKNPDYAVIKKESIKSFIKNIFNFLFSDEEDSSTNLDTKALLKKFIENKDELVKDDILVASIAYELANTDELTGGSIVVTENLKSWAKEDLLTSSFETNPWRKEVGNLLNAVSGLEGLFDSEETLDYDKVIKKFSDDSSHMLDNNASLLHKYYDSYIIAATLTKNLNQSLIPDFIDEKIEQSNSYDKKNKMYTFDEMYNFFYSLRELGVDISKLTSGEGEDSSSMVNTAYDNMLNIVDSGDKNGFGKIWASRIIAFLISKEIDKALYTDESNKLVPNKHVLSSQFIKETNGIAYKSDEVYGTLRALRAIFGIGKLDGSMSTDISFEKVKELTENNIRNELYSSYLTRVVLTYQFTDILKSNHLISETVLNNRNIMRTESDGIQYITENEFVNCIMAMKSIGLDNPEDFNMEVSMLSNEETKTALYKSYIAMGCATKSIQDQINANSGFVDTKKAYRPDIDIYKTDEIDALIELVGDTNIGALESTSYRLSDIRRIILSEDGKVKSYLMVAALTKILIDSDNFILLSTDYDSTNKVLKDTALVQILDALEILGITSPSSGITYSLSLPREQLDVIFENPSIRAAISEAIKISHTEEFIVSCENRTQYVQRLYDVNNIQHAVLSKDELHNFMVSLDMLGMNTIEWNISNDSMYAIKDMTEEERLTLLNSSIVQSMVSAYLIKGLKYGPLTVNYSSVEPLDPPEDANMIEFAINKSYTEKLLSKEQINKFYNDMSAYIEMMSLFMG